MGYSDVLHAGTILAERYEIVKTLGKGGMGSVYLAKDTRLSDSPRAIKQMAVEFIDQDQFQKAIDDFKREADVLAKVDHPSIPHVYDYFVESGYYFLVMKLVGGRDLEDLMAAAPDGAIDEKTVTKWGIQLCDVFNYIHNLKPPIIYRDMKPANVMYDAETDRLSLIDFGIARFVHSSQNVTAIGTVGYAPPELFLGKVTPASDIYSLGVTLIHLLTGKMPVANPISGLNYASNPHPNQVNPKLSKNINSIMLKAVEPLPENRYASAADMKKALERHLYEMENPDAVKSAPVENATMVGAPTELPPEIANLLKGAKLKIVHCASGNLNSFLLNKPSMVIGRYDSVKNVSPEIDLANYDNSGKISRRHAEITKVGNNYFIEGSGANGTLYNGSLLTAGTRQQLSHGDMICVGETVLEFSNE